jgi:hydrogenase nickel incorporation protein HypB
VRLEAALLAKNDALAAENRAWLAERGIVALNLMGAPGAGKTTLLVETLRRIASEIPAGVLEGDQETERDAERIRDAGCRAVQITTGAGCHLDASMVSRGLRALEPAPRSLLFVENVGNLVCPALFDLGERTKVVVMSVTEGDDKPAKYPHMFRAADVLVLNKIDLAPHVDFDVERCLADARALRPGLRVFVISARGGDGMDAWCAFLRDELHARGAA